MNVAELYHFTNWIQEHVASAQKRYQTLGDVLQNNATQSVKQAVSDPMDELITVLKNAPLDELTNEQVNALRELGVGQLIGESGVQYVTETVTKGNYDPATASAEIAKAIQTLSQANQGMKQINSAFANYAFLTEVDEAIDGQVTIRVQFKDGAAIKDVVDWKKWSNEWHEIVRGIALTVGEAPEATRVIGATKGSLILILSSTLGFTGALAVITKNMSYIVKEGLQIANSIEDLRHKKFLNKAIEDNLNKQRAQAAASGLKTVVEETKKSLPAPINGEQEEALTRAVEKFLRFSELGGSLDFVNPPELADATENEHAELSLDEKKIADIRRDISEIHSLRDEMKLLTQQLPDEKI